MGYTHYWHRPLAIETDAMRKIADDFTQLIAPLAAHGIKLAGGMGDGEPEISTQRLLFNGDQHCGHVKNAAISIPWPTADAGGIGNSLEGKAGSWFAGASLETRCCNGDCSYETFYLPRILEREFLQPNRERPSLYFSCCKTAFRPYDIAVTAALIVAKRRLGDQFIVSSDGEDTHWWDGKMLCQSILGYGLEYRIPDDGGELAVAA